MSFIDNVKQWYKMFSIWIYGLIVIAGILQANWDMYAQYLPDSVSGWLVAALGIIGGLARIIKQPELHEEEAGV